MKIVRSLKIAALCVLAITGSQKAYAQSCTFTIDNLDFGTIDVTSNQPYVASGTFRANCSGVLLSAVRICPNIGSGTGGIDSSGAPRHLASGGNKMAFNIFSDGGYATIWGSHVWPWSYTPPTTDITLIILGSGTTSRPIYARIPNGQQALPAGTYTSTFSGAHTQISYAAYLLGLGAPSCASLTSPSSTAPFTVTATNSPNCIVSATSLDFGSRGVLNTAIDAANELDITCTAATSFSVGLDGGSGGATDPTQRKMKKASETITYGLYRDNSRVQPWGSTIGTNTLSGTGTGFSQTLNVYGRVPAQTTPSPGTYTDTIVVTVTY